MHVSSVTITSNIQKIIQWTVFPSLQKFAGKDTAFWEPSFSNEEPIYLH